MSARAFIVLGPLPAPDRRRGHGRGMRTGPLTAAVLSGSLAALFAAEGRGESAPAAGAPSGGYETVVVAAPTGSAPSARQVDQATIATTPVSSGDDLLRLVPGLLVGRHGSEGKGRQLYLRGFDAAHGADVEVIVEGVPWNEASNVHGQGYLDLGPIIPEVVLTIGVAKGPLRLEQGPFATAGSIAFTLGVSPDRRGTRLGYDIGSLGRHRAVAVIAPGDSGRGSFAAVEGVRDPGYGVNRETDRASATGRAVLLERDGHTLALTGLAHAARFGEPGTVPLADWQAGRIGFYDSLSPDTDGSSARALAVLAWQHRSARRRTSVSAFGQGRRLILEENFTGFLIDAARGDRLRQAHRATGGGLRFAHDEMLSDRLALRAGADLYGDWLDQLEDRLDAAHAPYARTRSLGGLQATAGGRAGVRWLARPWLLFETGLRGDLFAFDVEDRLTAVSGRRLTGAWSPRLTVSFFPHPAVVLLAGYGRGVRPPEARAIATGGSATDPASYRGGLPRPTVSDHLEVGGRARLGSALELGTALFATFIEREQIFDHVSGTNLELNATRRLGLELDATVRPQPWLALRADATFVDARFVGSGAPVPGAPTLLATGEAHVFGWGGFFGGARLLALGPRPLAFGARAGAVGLADAMAGWRRGRIEVSLVAENLLGARWRQGEFNYASRWDLAQPASPLPQIHYAAGPPRVVRLGLAVLF